MFQLDDRMNFHPQKAEPEWKWLPPAPQLGVQIAWAWAILSGKASCQGLGASGAFKLEWLWLPECRAL